MIKRDNYLKKLIAKKENGLIKVITGLRRSGKSYLLFTIYKNYLLEQGINESQIIELSLDDISNLKYRNPFNLDEYIKSKIKNTKEKYFIFLDEIQMCSIIENPYVKGDYVSFVDVLLGLIKRDNLEEIKLNIIKKEFTLINEDININVEIEINEIKENCEEINLINEIKVSEKEEENEFSMIVYFIKQEDTLWDVCKKFKVSQSQICEYNNIEDAKLIPGNKLYIVR